MKESRLREIIRREVGRNYTTKQDAAKAFGISAQYLSELLRTKPITDKVARKFGYQQKEREFEKITEAKCR
jgi:Zn-dependent peptidase ImmA (M78 family)